MCPQCRYVRPAGGTGDSRALAEGQRCRHTRLHPRHGQRRPAHPTRRQAQLRRAALPAPSDSSTSILPADTIDDGTPLAPQEYGYDNEDYDDEEEEEYESE
jgi:hypothetical protein